MNEFRSKIGEDGRIVIPAYYRRLLGIEPGEEVIIRIANDELRLFSLKHSLKKAQTLIQQHIATKDLVKKLKEIRQEDSKNE